MNLFPPGYEKHQRAAPDEPARFAELRTGKMAKPTPPPVSPGVSVLSYACPAAIVLAIIALIDLSARH
jgi:hypothetical protein